MMVDLLLLNEKMLDGDDVTKFKLDRVIILYIL